MPKYKTQNINYKQPSENDILTIHIFSTLFLYHNFIAPEYKVTMEAVIHAIGRKPLGAELLVAGDFSMDILAAEGRRAENIATDLATAGVEDMAHNFMPKGDGGQGDRTQAAGSGTDSDRGF